MFWMISRVFRFLRNSHISSTSKNISSDSIRVAYLFVVHGRGLRQVLRTFKLLQNPQDYFYFHVDTRSGYLHRNLKILEKKYPQNIKVTDIRWATIWGGASLLKMMISSIKGQWLI